MCAREQMTKQKNNWHINICHLPKSAFMLAAQLNAFSHFPCAFLRADIHISYTVTGCAKGFLWCMQHHSATLYVLHKFMNTREHVLRWLIIQIPELSYQQWIWVISDRRAFWTIFLQRVLLLLLSLLFFNEDITHFITESNALMSDITSRWRCGLAVPMPESRYSDSEVCLFGLLSQWHDGDAGLFIYFDFTRVLMISDLQIQKYPRIPRLRISYFKAHPEHWKFSQCIRICININKQVALLINESTFLFLSCVHCEAFNSAAN